MPRLLYALSHVASQIAYKWLPAPTIDTTCDTPLLPFEADMSPEEVREFIRCEMARRPPRLAWLETYLKKTDPEAKLLIEGTIKLARRCRDEGARWICPTDNGFPPLLRTIPDPPLGLLVFGAVELLCNPLIAVVGSRKASAAAIHASYDAGNYFASAGATVVSGGAFGCDIAAHHGVLAAAMSPAPACCVFAGGLDVLYPRGNDAIFRRLRERSAVLMSERLWGATCRPVDFHARNRLISGMAGTTLLMQAAERSGALMTARLAIDQGRDLAVFRHPEDDVRGGGSAALLRDGAFGFSSVSELVKSLER